jgi:hypothetical protein
MAKKKAKNNPWAICTSSVGRKPKKKYESCVMSVKKQHGMEAKEPMNDIDKIASFLTDDPNTVLEQGEAEALGMPPAAAAPAPAEPGAGAGAAAAVAAELPGEMDEPGMEEPEAQYVIMKYSAPEGGVPEAAPEGGVPEGAPEGVPEGAIPEGVEGVEDVEGAAPEGAEGAEGAPAEPTQGVWGPYPNREAAINDLRACVADEHGTEVAEQMASQISAGTVQIGGVTEMVVELTPPKEGEASGEPAGEAPPPPEGGEEEAPGGGESEAGGGGAPPWAEEE